MKKLLMDKVILPRVRRQEGTPALPWHSLFDTMEKIDSITCGCTEKTYTPFHLRR